MTAGNPAQIVKQLKSLARQDMFSDSDYMQALTESINQRYIEEGQKEKYPTEIDPKKFVEMLASENIIEVIDDETTFEQFVKDKQEEDKNLMRRVKK